MMIVAVAYWLVRKDIPFTNTTAKTLADILTDMSKNSNIDTRSQW